MRHKTQRTRLDTDGPTPARTPHRRRRRAAVHGQERRKVNQVYSEGRVVEQLLEQRARDARLLGAAGVGRGVRVRGVGLGLLELLREQRACDRAAARAGERIRVAAREAHRALGQGLITTASVLITAGRSGGRVWDWVARERRGSPVSAACDLCTVQVTHRGSATTELATTAVTATQSATQTAASAS